MKTLAEQLQDLQDTIKQFEKHIQDTKVTPANLSKTQDYLDTLEKHYPPKDRSTNTEMIFHMYELQALIDVAKGNVRRAKAFVSEALDLDTDDKFVSETVRELTSTTGKAGKGKKVEFFVVSPLRFILMFILTIGIYSAYWFYKNWQAVEKATGRRQYPFLSAVFSKFISYNLFVDIKKAAEANGWRGQFSPGWRAVAYFFFGPFALIGTSELMYAAGGVKHDKSFNKGEIILLILGLLYWGFLIIGAINSDSSSYKTSRYRTTFINECQSGSVEAGTFSAFEARTYCTCVYDKGTDQLGYDEFVSQTAGLTTSSNLSGPVGMIISNCVHEVQSV